MAHPPQISLAVPSPDPVPSIDTLWTIGHSTRSWDDFLALLIHWRIEAIVDVRRFPGSRRYPWFASETMAEQLAASRIDYHWLPHLGGRRRAQPGSPNGAWRSNAFQGYADHMTSDEFADGLSQTLAVAAKRRTALMCAEALWWGCHRRLVADLLTHRGVEVCHILDIGKMQPHVMHPDARPAGADLVYPPTQAGLF
ncbi:DUF488 domain-containing protein [Luteimonas fraxinea]|uniref:DUF488 domain-containing protein n=1 Tax=Luteimonas fraxinea TaxID=2901869 RepID=A0ABS8UCL5_9GAMM|nr:DUF488 domain-containing protein [Luteimonas fraxinea]MCD9096809.1 DUF488 domain-containing protein [Luteimonas fraxinea]UHH09842.1 DUF488 domain-containing protein [Luteimonas fraxinea]